MICGSSKFFGGVYFYHTLKVIIRRIIAILIRGIIFIDKMLFFHEIRMIVNSMHPENYYYYYYSYSKKLSNEFYKIEIKER